MNIEKTILESLAYLRDSIPQKMEPESPDIEKIPRFYTNSKTNRLAFPSMYGQNGNPEKYRFSEQEARFAFTAILETQNDYYYSVEAPTVEKYIFSDDGKIVPRIATKDERVDLKNPKGQSARVDVCLYRKNPLKDSGIADRPHYIEFKANNPAQSDFSKDFLKLLYDFPCGQNYFVHVAKSVNKRTIISVANKYFRALLAAEEGTKDARDEAEKIAEFRSPNKLIIYLCFFNDEDFKDTIKKIQKGKSPDSFTDFVRTTIIETEMKNPDGAKKEIGTRYYKESRSPAEVYNISVTLLSELDCPMGGEGSKNAALSGIKITIGPK